MRPCGMCARLCWRCEERHAKLKAEWEREGERVASLEIAFANASDSERDEISERLQDAIEEWWQMGEELDGAEPIVGQEYLP